LKEKPALSAASIWFTLEAMSALNRPEEEADWQQFESMKQIAWKTGTSYGGRDAWAIGLTPRYVVGVWTGNASGEGRPGLTGVGNAAPVLFDIFSLLPGSPWFDMPYDELESVAICRSSGHKASALCEPVDTVYIPRSGLVSDVCPYHQLVHLSPDGQFRVNTSCEPVDRIVTCSWFVLPPSQAYYYRNYHIDYVSLPPIRPGCEQAQSRQLDIIYPEHNSSLYLPKGFTGELERFVFRAAHTRPEAVLYWHIDDEYLGETKDNHQMACRIGPGKHTLTLVDSWGNQVVRVVRVVK
jgi:penicillin-binding protein 1C